MHTDFEIPSHVSFFFAKKRPDVHIPVDGHECRTTPCSR